MSLENLQEHSPVGPSSGDRWMFCPGSVAATAHLPDTTSDYAAEGTFAHYISELSRKEGKDAAHYIGRVSDDGKFTVDQVMADAVQDFLDYCDQFPGDTFIEQRVNYDAWVDNGFGTADHISIDEASKTCYVIDLKYGQGLQINAPGNTQLKLYALGVLQDWGGLYEIEKFVLCISQPRLRHRDQWEITAEKLVAWADEKVEPGADKVYEAIGHLDMYKDDKPFQEAMPEFFRAGGWCQWCKVKGACPTRTALMRESALEDLDDIEEFEEPEVKPVTEMSDKKLGETAIMVTQIQKWCRDVMDTVEKRVMQGAKIPSGVDFEGEVEYFKMVEGRSNRQWRDMDEATKALRNAKVKAADMYVKKLISAPQAEKLLGKAHAIFTKKNLVVKPQGKPVLVPGADRRESFAIAVDELDELE